MGYGIRKISGGAPGLGTLCFGDGSTSISFKYISSFVSPRTPYTSANRYALYLLESCLVSLEDGGGNKTEAEIMKDFGPDFSSGSLH